MKQSLPVLLALGAAFLALPAAQPQDRGKEEVPLKAEVARKALIELAERSDDVLVKLSLPGLKKSKIVSAGGDELTIGRWRCNLVARTFVLSLASDAGFFEISGVFEQSKDHKWRAKVTRKRQT
jgi:hypothetical protein